MTESFAGECFTLIQHALPICQRAVHHDFDFVRELVFNVLLHSAKHERFEDHMQTGQVLLVDARLVLGMRLDVFGEPFVELLVRIEQRWHDEMQQGPQLGHAVLNRCSRQQQPVSAVEPEEHLPASTRRALDGLRFIEHHVLPIDPVEVLVVGHDQLVRSDHDVETRLGRVQIPRVPKLAQYLPLLRVAPVRNDFEIRDETGQLLLPIVQRRRWRYDEERPPNAVTLGYVSQEGYGLDSLPQSHFVR